MRRCSSRTAPLASTGLPRRRLHTDGVAQKQARRPSPKASRWTVASGQWADPGRKVVVAGKETAHSGRRGNHFVVTQERETELTSSRYSLATVSSRHFQPVPPAAGLHGGELRGVRPGFRNSRDSIMCLGI